MDAATTPGMRANGPQPSASSAARGEVPVCTDRATRSEAVSGTGRKGHVCARIRAVPAAAHLFELVEVLVHLGAPCPHSRKSTRRSWCSTHSHSGCPRIEPEERLRQDGVLSGLGACGAHGNGAQLLPIKEGIKRELLTGYEAARAKTW